MTNGQAGICTARPRGRWPRVHVHLHLHASSLGLAAATGTRNWICWRRKCRTRTWNHEQRLGGWQQRAEQPKGHALWASVRSQQIQDRRRPDSDYSRAPRQIGPNVGTVLVVDGSRVASVARARRRIADGRDDSWAVSAVLRDASLLRRRYRFVPS